ncbi:hypothetical protein PGT21_025858 [Puccinia graminis f. sp. tritici]|uniref:Uncharacterized protein n=1 Tax=Puccinia graminis f. sp. tritici TaxID=56615 RepID=A0A5B0MMG9_PUCGR|nr:hypothetical protein PGT21_025858 [Puccinia graminis f. sp. tritici]
MDHFADGYKQDMYNACIPFVSPSSQSSSRGWLHKAGLISLSRTSGSMSYNVVHRDRQGAMLPIEFLVSLSTTPFHRFSSPTSFLVAPWFLTAGGPILKPMTEGAQTGLSYLPASILH